MSKEAYQFWGIVAAAVIPVIGSIIVKLIELKGKNSRKTKSTARRKQRILRWLRISIIVIWLLATAASLAYVVWQPGRASLWFIRMHLASVMLTALAGFALLASMISAASLPAEAVGETQSPSHKGGRQLGLTIFLSIAFVAACGNLGKNFVAWQSLAESTQLMSKSFDLMNIGDYQGAISTAEDCSAKYHIAASQIEKKMASSAPPPTGEVGQDVRKKILSNGALNDVAACYWIKGRSSEALNRASEAGAAYVKTMEYPHARVWDPKGFFWSPADDAHDRLEEIGVIGEIRLTGSSESLRNGALIDDHLSVIFDWPTPPPNSELWIAVYSKSQHLFFPQECIKTATSQRALSCALEIGGTADVGGDFQIEIAQADENAQRVLSEYLVHNERAGMSQLPIGTQVLEGINVRRK